MKFKFILFCVYLALMSVFVGKAQDDEITYKVYFNIYTYGVNGGGDLTATPIMTKKFITAGGETALVLVEGTSYADEGDALTDPIRFRPEAQWIIVPEMSDVPPAVGESAGAVTVRNRATGEYLRIAASLSADPVDIYFTYRKNENGKPGYSIHGAANGGGNCLQPSSGNAGLGTTGYADRTRMHFVLDEIRVPDDPIVVSDCDYFENFEGITFSGRLNGPRPLPDNNVYFLRDGDNVASIHRAGNAVNPDDFISIQNDEGNNYMRYSHTGDNWRPVWFAMPDVVGFEKQISVEFDFNTADFTSPASTPENPAEGQIWFCSLPPYRSESGSTAAIQNNEVLFLISVPNGTENFDLTVALPQNLNNTTGNAANGFGPGEVRVLATIDAEYKKTLNDLARSTWYTMKVVVNLDDGQVEFTVKERDDDESTVKSVNIPVPDYYTASGMCSILINPLRSGANSWQIGFDNLCVNTDIAFYNLSFDTQTTEVQNPKDIRLQVGSVVGELPVVSRDAYNFKGWNTEADGSGETYTKETVFESESDVTLYAQWVEKVPYNLHFDTQTTELDNPEDKIVMSGIAVGDLPSVSREGYSFQGWNTAPDGSGTPYTKETVFTSESDVTLYAQWIKSYIIKYDTQTNEEVANPANKTVLYEKEIGALATTYWIGYKFIEWNTKPDGTGDPFTATTEYNFDRDTTLFAQWEALPTVDAFAEDFKSVTADLKGEIVQGGIAGTSNSFLFHDRGTADGDFLRFQFSGESGGRSSMFALNSNVHFEKKAIVEFDWWTTSITAGEGQILFRNGTNVLFSMYKANGVANQIGVVVGPLSGTVATVDEAYRMNYTDVSDSEWNHVKVEIFAGSHITFTITRTTDPDFIRAVTLPLPDGATEKGINNILFNAIRTGGMGWNTRLTNLDIQAADGDAPSNTFVLSFNVQTDLDVATPPKQLVTGGEAVGALPVLYKPGYSFDGWNTKTDGSGIMLTETAIFDLNANTTLYAIWGDNVRIYLISFDTQVEGIDNPADKRVTFYQPIGVLPSPVRENYRFIGWVAENGAKIYADLNYVFERDITLYAQWLDVSMYDYYEPFDVQAANQLQGTIVHGGGTLLSLDVMGGYLKFDATGSQGGGRDSRFNLTPEKPLTYTKKLVVDFDWYSNDFTGGAGAEGQVQFRSGNNALFTLFNARGDVNRLGFAVGTLPEDIALNANPLNFTRENLASKEWYNVKVEIYLGQRVDFTLTDKDGEVTDVTLALPSGFDVKSIDNLWFRGTRTASVDFTWLSRVDNLGIRVADDDPPVVAYMISFDTQSSVEFPSAKKVTFGAPIGKIPELTRTGYVFNGWNTEKDGSGIWFTGLTIYEEEKDITLYAIWTPNTYTIVFDTQTTDVAQPANLTVTFDAEVGELPAVTRNGFRFDGWSNLPDGTYVNIFTAETKYTYSKDTTLYALWTDNREAFTLSFDSQFAGIDNPASVQVAQGKATGWLFGDMPVLTREGYSLVGWFTEPEGKGQKIMDYTLYTFNRNITVYAYWLEIEPVDYTGYNYVEDFEDKESYNFIALSGNNGARPADFVKGSRGVIRNGTGGPISIFDINENKSLRILANDQSGQRMGELWLPDTIAFTKKLTVEFDFWTTRFQGVSDAEGQIWFMSKDSVALFTMFVFPESSGSVRTKLGIATGLTPVYFNVTNPSNGGLMIDNSQAFTKAAKDCSATLIDLPVSQVSRPLGSPQVDNVSIWYHVTVEFYAGQYMRFLITSPHYRGELYLPLPEGFEANSLSEIAISGTRPRSNNLFWEARIDNLGVKVADSDPDDPTYLLNFDLNLGDDGPSGITQPFSKPVKPDEEVGELPAPARSDGYIFAGWFLDPEDTDGAVTAATVFTFNSNITLYAHWMEATNVYTMSFDTQCDVPNPEDKRVIYDMPVGSSELGLLPVVTRAGYTFKEWNTQADGEGDAISNNTYYLYENDITVYAKWTANKYLLTFNTQAIVGQVTQPDDKEVTFDEAIGTLPTLTRKDYTFDGWFDAATAGTQWTAVTVFNVDALAKVDKDDKFTLYAYWTYVTPQTGEPELTWIDLKVYPNPVADVFTISGLEIGDLIAVFDLGGRSLINAKASGEKEEISVGNLPQGTYLVKITRSKAEKTIKIVVK